MINTLDVIAITLVYSWLITLDADSILLSEEDGDTACCPESQCTRGKQYLIPTITQSLLNTANTINSKMTKTNKDPQTNKTNKGLDSQNTVLMQKLK